MTNHPPTARESAAELADKMQRENSLISDPMRNEIYKYLIRFAEEQRKIEKESK